MTSHEQEFLVKLPERDSRRKFHVMKFNSSLNVDTATWAQVRMVRENNKKEYVREDGMPKFGAGSEFGRDLREEARRKKYGIVSKKYNPDAQPWLMRVGSKKDGKTYRGVREGGISDNTTYYVFTHAKDGSFEAHPVTEWYNFTPRVNYKTLNEEEAEERFAERSKILNHFAIMVGKKLKQSQDDNEDFDDEEVKGKKKSKGNSKDFKVSDMDDWVESGDELDSDSGSESGKKKKSDDDDDDNDSGKKKKNSRSKDSKKRPKKKKDDTDNEAFEDSDDGDHEGSEVDYMSDESSDSEEELQAKGDIKGVDQDEGLAKMLDSESSEDEFEDKKEDDDENKQDEDKEGKKNKKKKDEGKGSSKSSANNSRATTPTPGASESGPSDEKAARLEKRKRLVDSVLDPNSEPAGKKMRNELFSSNASSSSAPPPAPNSIEAALEEDVRRYLARKPMTTTELLKKLSSKKTKVQKDELMPVLYNILTRIDPHKHKVKGVMYLSLKGDK